MFLIFLPFVVLICTLSVALFLTRKKYSKLSFDYGLLIEKLNYTQRESAEKEGRFSEQKKILENVNEQISQSLQYATSSAMKESNASFFSLAEKTFKQLHEHSKESMMQTVMNPLQTALKKVDEKLEGLEKERVSSYADLRRQLTSLAQTQDHLRCETGNLLKALHTPSVRGQWGEMQLQRTVEMAGMEEHCDFTTQTTLKGGALRPDMIIRLPQNRHIIVDAKTPLKDYLFALDVQESEREPHLKLHAKHLRDHIKKLGQKNYWEHLESTPEFVVLFLPNESFLTAALKQDPTLIEFGIQQQVILSTPTTLIALLKSIAFGWKQENLTQDARKIAQLGRDLSQALGQFSGQMGKIGYHLKHSVEQYNQALNTLENKVLTPTRELKEIDIPPVKKVEHKPLAIMK